MICEATRTGHVPFRLRKSDSSPSLYRWSLPGGATRPVFRERAQLRASRTASPTRPDVVSPWPPRSRAPRSLRHRREERGGKHGRRWAVNDVTRHAETHREKETSFRPPDQFLRLRSAKQHRGNPIATRVRSPQRKTVFGVSWVSLRTAI